MTIEEIVSLHTAGFLASASRIALMMQDPAHLNSESKELKEEFETATDYFQDAFKAKNVQRQAECVLEKIAKKSPP